MAVEPKLSDAEITSLIEIPHPSKGPGESIYGAKVARNGAIINTTWTF